MRDAVGGSLLLNLVVLFTSVIILFFAGIMAYSKAYKAKNKIIEVIEQYEVYNENVANVINGDLELSGYRAASKAQINQKCETGNLNQYGYYYCVYKVDRTTSGVEGGIGGESYQVVTYIHFDFPVIGSMLVIPVKGETRILGKNYNY